MNKLSLSVLGHILSFNNDLEMVRIIGISKIIKNVIESNVRYKYQHIKHNWIKSISFEVMKYYGDNLDIGESKNGEPIFYIAGFNKSQRINVVFLPVYDRIIERYSEAFVNAGTLFDWSIYMGRFSVTRTELHYDPFHIMHKLVVYPCRIHKIKNSHISSLPLYYYPYIYFKYRKDGNKLFEYVVNQRSFLADFHFYLTAYHPIFVKENALYLINKMGYEIIDIKPDISLFNKVTQYFDFKPEWDRSVLIAQMAQLIQRKKELQKQEAKTKKELEEAQRKNELQKQEELEDSKRKKELQKQEAKTKKELEDSKRKIILANDLDEDK